MSEELVRKLAADIGGTIEEMQRLPDGSGFAIMSMPLPKDHWSVVNPEASNEPPMRLRCGETGGLIVIRNGETLTFTRQQMAELIREAGRYAYRCATMNGKDTDIDPDALLQNLVVGMIGYWTDSGLSNL